MKPGTILLSVACLAVGFLVGMLVPRDFGTEPVGEENGIDGPDRPANRLNTGNAGTLPSRVGIRPDASSGGVVLGNPEEAGSNVLVEARILADLGLPGSVGSFKQQLVQKGGRIEAYLDLTDDEMQQLESNWEGVRAKLRKAEVAASRSEVLADGSARIVRPPLPTEMQNLHQDFISEVGSILGPERGEVFLALKGTDTAFEPAEGEAIYTVAVEETGDGGWRFRITQEEDGERRMWVGDRIPDEIRHLADAAGVVDTLKDKEP